MIRLTLCFALLIAASPIWAEPDNAELGKSLYQTCSACHLASGGGVAGTFPPINNRLAQIAAEPEGRRYLVSVLLRGLNGSIMVGDKKYNGFMQPYGNVYDDQQASAVLNYVAVSLSDKAVEAYVPFEAEEIARIRKSLSQEASNTLALRKQLELK